MARTYEVQPADRSTLRAALKHTEKKANAAANTNRHLELTQGESEALSLSGYCAEVLKVLDEQTVGAALDLTASQVYAARCALRVFGGVLEKKQDEIGTLLLQGDDMNVEEIAAQLDKVAALLRILSPQADLFVAAPGVPEAIDDAPADEASVERRMELVP